MEGDMKDVLKYWLGGEISSFIKVWLSAYISLSFCYFAGKIVPKGLPRFMTLFPVVCLFLVLPLNLHSMHLGGLSAFFLAWLTNFKLLLFAFDKGPLSDPSISLPFFVVIACLPIKIQHNRPKKSNTSQNGHFKENTSPETSNTYLNYAVKGLLLALFLKVYDYIESIHPKVILFVYCLHIYFCLEINLAIAAALARALLGLELEPQFNKPLLSTSLQEFWSRRWNLMVTRILRPAVYEPVLKASTQILGRKWATSPAVFATFAVSGLMHELMFYYLGRVTPTWEITLFFLLHGVSLIVEIAIKKVVTARYRLPRIISTLLTFGIVVITGSWLFFPQLLRCKVDVRAFEEYAAIGAFVKDISRSLTAIKA